MSSVSTAVADAMAGALTRVSDSSIGRFAAGVDATAMNLIEGVVSPATRQTVMSRGYQYRNNSASGAQSVLTVQQLQIAKTSSDLRIVRVQRDSVNLLTRACQYSDALGRKHPTFDQEGATHLRLTFSAPTTIGISGFEHRTAVVDSVGPPDPRGGSTVAGAGSEPIPALVSDCSDQGEEPDQRLHTEESTLRRTDSTFIGGGLNLSDDETLESDSLLSDRPASTPLGHLGERLEATQAVSRQVRKASRWQIVNNRWSSVGEWCETKMPSAKGLCGMCSKTYGAASGATDKARSFFGSVARVANPAGARDLYVLDVTLPTAVVTACMETADMLLIEDKAAKNLHVQKALRKLRRHVSGNVSQGTYNYLETITTLAMMAMALDLGASGTNHCRVLGYTANQPDFSDFFASTKLEDALDDLKDAKAEAGHPLEHVVWAGPAPEVKGSLNETLVMYETAQFGDYELKEKKRVIGAVHVGVDLLGKQAPNDHTDPLSFVSAVYRHLGDSQTTVAEGTPWEYVIHLDRSKKSKLSSYHDRVWDDLIDDQGDDFKELLTTLEQRFDFDFQEDGKPSSYSEDSYEHWLTEQLADERFFQAENAMTDLLSQIKATKQHMQDLKASGACKKGEDSNRARMVITPGRMGSEGLHQARTSPLIRALEALHAAIYNHTNLKGLNEETKRIRFAEFLRAVPQMAIVFGTDKSKNDACFREAVWKKCIAYLARMADIFEEKVTVRPYVYAPDEHIAENAFPNGTLDLKYWIIKLTPMMAILLSGIGPTSFFNRLESTVENGVGVLVMHGEEAYQKWRKAERCAQVSTHPAWDFQQLPHAAEFVEWAPLAPCMVKDTSIKVANLKDDDIYTYHMGIREGDDQLHCFIPPMTDEWRGLDTKSAIAKYVSLVSEHTGFIFEAAYAANPLDMVGHNAVFEMLSGWSGMPKGNLVHDGPYEKAVIVPKVLKALRKLPYCALSSEHKVDHTDMCDPDVIKDEKYWSLGLTKYYSLALMNYESLGVRGLFLSHGDYCYEQLIRLLGKQGAFNFSVTYGDRDPERRDIEEFSATKFEHCGVMRDAVHEQIARVNEARVIRVCACAWRNELPGLEGVDKVDLYASLLAFDHVTMRLNIDANMVEDPMLLWESLSDIGCILEPLVRQATGSLCQVAKLYRSPKMFADSTETVELARKLACVKSKVASDKDRGSDSAAKPPNTAKGKGKSKPDGKGKGADGPKSKGKGKPQPSKGKGKGKAPEPADSKPTKVSWKRQSDGLWMKSTSSGSKGR